MVTCLKQAGREKQVPKQPSFRIVDECVHHPSRGALVYISSPHECIEQRLINILLATVNCLQPRGPFQKLTRKYDSRSFDGLFGVTPSLGNTESHSHNIYVAKNESDVLLHSHILRFNTSFYSIRII